MGQRLNIQIQRGDTVLANAYYHWSAYTMSTLGLLKTIQENWQELAKEENDIIRAVRLLESTGAGLTEQELIAEEKLGGAFIPGHLATSRNDGLIAISESGIQETIDWAEGNAIIDLDDAMVNFDVYFRYDDEEHMASDYEDEVITELPDFNFDISHFALKDASAILEVLEQNGKFLYKTGDGDHIALIA